MAAKLAEGATVRLADREPTAADIKSQIFFPALSRPDRNGRKTICRWNRHRHD